jgi:hypothetical protein
MKGVDLLTKRFLSTMQTCPPSNWEGTGRDIEGCNDTEFKSHTPAPNRNLDFNIFKIMHVHDEVAGQVFGGRVKSGIKKNYLPSGL